jgi:hypothetical protein
MQVNMLNSSLLFLTCALPTLVFFIYTSLRTRLRHHQYARLHGCQPYPRLPQWDQFFGLDLLVADIAAAKNRLLLSEALSKYNQLGSTWSFILMGHTSIATIDPENLKAILASQFDDFSVGGRADLLGRLVGRGIFTNDGKEWEHSRVCK